jgi:hypothetical protein
MKSNIVVIIMIINQAASIIEEGMMNINNKCPRQIAYPIHPACPVELFNHRDISCQKSQLRPCMSKHLFNIAERLIIFSLRFLAIFSESCERAVKQPSKHHQYKMI